MSLPILPPHHRRASASSISCSTGFSLQSGDTPAPARHSFIRGVYSAIPATSLPSVIEQESTMGSNIDNRSGAPCSAPLPLPKSSPCKTIPLVFMTRGEREARSSEFYPGALTSRFHSSYERGCQEKRLLPAPRRDAGLVTCIQPSHSRKGECLAASARCRFQRRCQSQLLVPTRSFHELRCSTPFVLKLRKRRVGSSANHDPM